MRNDHRHYQNLNERRCHYRNASSFRCFQIILLAKQFFIACRTVYINCWGTLNGVLKQFMTE